MAKWRRDLTRYPARAWAREPSIYAVALLRWGQHLDQAGRQWIPSRVYWLAFRVLEVVLGISITKNTEVGAGLRVHHFGGIFVNERARIGTDCTLRQGVTIGNRTDGGAAPVLGNRVDVGAYAQILGDVRVGDDASIGAMAVVLKDVPAGASAVGNPARIIESSAGSAGVEAG